MTPWRRMLIAAALACGPIASEALGSASAAPGVKPPVKQAMAQPAAKTAPARATPAKPGPTKPVAAKPASSLAAYVQSLWPLAQARGISRETFDSAMRGLTLDPAIVALTKKQAEFSKPMWSYLASAITSGRIAQGANMAGEWSGTLAQAEASYGVPREILLGIWGMETNFGSYKGDKDVIRSLATLAYLRYRDDFFRDELLIALDILEKGHADRADLRGSWAGAMGHTQFMPSSYLKYAVSRSGAGAADIWSSAGDALVSTANYLKGHGWQSGLPWGMEVTVPEGLDLSTIKRSFSGWTSAGVRRAAGGALPSSGEATLFFPAGIKGPAFLLTENFNVIKSYNSSDAYALAVAHLGDRIMGHAPIQGDWPTRDPQLSKAQREEVQKRLKTLGLYDGKIDGRLGAGTREAVRRFQLSAGLIADGYASPAVLARLKQGR